MNQAKTSGQQNNADILNVLDKDSRIINGFSVDSVTKAPLQLMQYAFT